MTDAIEMLPLYLPAGESRARFAWLHRPAQTPPRSVGIVLCPTVGEEYMMAHQSLRGLAEALAERGFAVVRPDLDGMGDSSGDDTEPERVAAWRASIDAACEVLRRRVGVERLGLFGLRFGAVLACAAATSRTDVASLSLCLPMANGKALAREVRAFQLLAGRSSDGDSEWAGFLFTGETLRALATLDPLANATALPPTTLIHRASVAPDEKLLGRLRALAPDLALVPADDLEQMLIQPHRIRIPRATWAALADALAARHPDRLASVAAEVARPRAAVAPGIDEAVVELAPGLRGVLCAPQSPTTNAPSTVIFLSTAGNHRVGPNRMYVRYARRLAAAGVTSLRFDVHHLGDSGERARETDGDLMHANDSIADASRAATALAARGHRHFTLVGLCSGAYLAFHAAQRDPGRFSSLFMINPQAFSWKKGDTLDLGGQISSYVAIDGYRTNMWKLDRWQRLFRGGVDVRRVAKNLVTRVGVVAAARARRVLDRFAGGNALERGLTSIVREQRIATTFLFGRGEPGLDFMRLHARRLLEQLTREPTFTLTVLDGVDHTATPYWSQEMIGELLLDTVMGKKLPSTMAARGPGI